LIALLVTLAPGQLVPSPAGLDPRPVRVPSLPPLLTAVSLVVSTSPSRRTATLNAAPLTALFRRGAHGDSALILAVLALRLVIVISPLLVVAVPSALLLSALRNATPSLALWIVSLRHGPHGVTVPKLVKPAPSLALAQLCLPCTEAKLALPTSNINLATHSTALWTVLRVSGLVSTTVPLLVAPVP
jgi:hypothetical protein